ncbi:beta-lactamase/transpeptidase-like protein [Chaetomium fimeti]|uniref:Beta-lactamase/transpeptidase-like protein n=1 Tax=Chaetomium fimeti TaxID=1854472 RepID=A0AAE0HC76_9PEZI|nr:beta-lactamase/transpeptidase-like protein [Chaetomium fimeti]
MTASYNTTAIAIGVKSIHETDLLFEYAYTPPKKDEKGVQKVDSDTIFRIGSLTKLFPPLALLKLQDRGVNFEDPITKYVPELRTLKSQAREDSPIWAVEWDEVTLGALASHMAGIPSDYITDIAPFGDLSAYGYPQANSSKFLGCAGFFGTPGCNKTVFFEHFGERPPVQAPFSAQTVYSNIGFAILGFAVEAITNQSFTDYVTNEIWKPLDMARTSATQPDEALGFIPANDVWWAADMGFEGPGGGYFSTINDLHRFGDAILQHKLLSAVQTRKWMKPLTSTSSSGLLMGAPWEIFRAENITSDGRMIELYTKTGDLINYHSQLVLIPDYDIVVTLLVAGPSGPGEGSQTSMTLMMSRIVQSLLPAIEAAGKAETAAAYAGTYTDKRTNSTLTLSLDAAAAADDGPGVAITQYIIRGVDVPRTDPGSTLPPATPPTLDPPMRYRLYPASTGAEGKTSWRAVGTMNTAEQVAQQDALFAWPMNSCITWAMMDRSTFEFGARDHFVFDVVEGKVKGVEAVGYQVHLTKECK